MTKGTLFLALPFIAANGFAQVPGYYNGTEGKSGSDLKAALHEIIDQHVDFSYSDAKWIMNYADEDPANTNNIILFYTKRSQSKDSWGSASNDINREHVWAKSHGNFSDIRPMDGDAYNLHPADASVNMARSNYDFDECSATGTKIDEAKAWYTSSQFEPDDAAKGEVARTIFYMAVRYEGTDNELDLEVVDALNTSPAPQHGKLSTLLQWNRDFPPTDLERRRNERVHQSQRNRNPFIDHPEYADLIWGGATAAVPAISNVSMSPEYPYANTIAQIASSIPGAVSASLYYGDSWDSESHTSAMIASGDVWTGELNLDGFIPGSYVYYKISANNNESSNTLRGSYLIPAEKTLTQISAVQGTGNATPISGNIVSIGGIVTANFDNAFYIQNGNDPRNGICVFDIKRGQIGDSVVVTGRATEYQNLTEVDNASYVYSFGPKTKIQPSDISLADVNESYEGMLVRFKNVTFLQGDTEIPYSTNTTLTITDGANSLNVFHRYGSRIGGKIVPSGTVNVTGVLSQYQDSYQLLINDIKDITTGEDDASPLIGGVIVNDVSWIEVSFSEKLDKTSAENLGNFTITDGVTIQGAYLYNDTKVLLLVTGLRQQEYTLTVTDVADLQGNAITEATFSFTSPYSSVGLEEKDETAFSLYPNPARDFIIMNAPAVTDKLIVNIIDMSGQVLFTRDYNASRGGIKIGISNLQEGFYILQVETKDKFESRIFSVKR